jgi:starch-binding outer membrane protein SusE/F
MKKIQICLFLLVAVCIAWSCGEDENMDPLGEWELSSAVLGTPSSGASITLDEETPTQVFQFDWQPATASNRFVVSYTFLLVPAESQDYANPILSITPGSAGKERLVKPTAEQIDYALWTKCYPAGQPVNLKWVVVAKAIEKEAVASNPITITRFATDYEPTTLFVTGAATEAGADPAEATPMRARTNADDEQTGVFDVYTTLTEGSTYTFRDRADGVSRVYGGADGTIEACGPAITAPATGQYRITVDLNSGTYELLKIDRWSLVGDAVEGGWGGDVPLTYKGNGVWESKIEFLKPYDDAGFIFRANGDWGYAMKRVKGTASANGRSGNVILESEAGSAGVEVEDLKIDGSGMHTVTLDLNAGAYNFNIVPDAAPPGNNTAIIGKTTNPDADAVTGNFTIGTYQAPEKLYLVSGGAMVAELTKNGNTFTSKYLALEKSKKYILNSASDGSGTTYNNIGNGEISVDHDQAYMLTVNFETGKLQWKHYNMKLFHWQDAEGGWDARKEYAMTYIHPYKFQATNVALTGGHASKFNSPWDVQFGTAGTALTGTMNNAGDSKNFMGITQSGNYDATITVSDDYATAEYSFVKK